MTILNRIRQHLLRGKDVLKDTDPVKAYNLWSQTYDDQPGNLMLVMDDELFCGMINKTDIQNKTVADVGCGTGRHWQKLMQMKPAQLLGYDTSIGMLNKLKDKFPNAEISQLQNNRLPNANSSEFDVVISTLTVAHIEDIEDAFREWNRVLKPGGELVITDYHPQAFVNGGNRTFFHNGQTVAIKNYTHPLETIRSMLFSMGFELISFSEKKVDDSVKHYYKQKNALHVFEKFKNIPIIYGMHLKKGNDIT